VLQSLGKEGIETLSQLQDIGPRRSCGFLLEGEGYALIRTARRGLPTVMRAMSTPRPSR